MPNLARNPDLSLAWRRPGTYIYINLNNPGAASGPKVLLLAERRSTGLLTANALYRANSEQDVIDNSGRGSAAHFGYQSLVAQVDPGNLEVWVGHVAEATGGAQATWPFVIAGTATGSGQVILRVCGRPVSVGFVSGDTGTTIAAALEVQLDTLTDLPITWGVSSGTVTGTFVHKALWAEEMGFQCYVTPGKGISIGPGDAAYATNASGAGSATLRCGRTTYTASVSNLDTPTIIAAAVAAAVEASDGPLSATANSGTLTVTFRNNRTVRRVIAKIVTSTGTTINWNGTGAIAAGTDAPAGVIGVGSPTLTTLLTTISAQGAFREWACPWNDATTLGTIDTQIETEAGGGGGQQKGQRLKFGHVAALATAGAVPAATTPALTASVRCGLLWPAFEPPNAGFEYACRIAAACGANDRPAKNFNGLVLKSTTRAPLVAPDLVERSASSDINSAINAYFMAPIVWNDELGRPVVEHSRTTSNSSDRALHKWSLIAQLDEQRDRTRLRMNERFQGTSLMLTGEPFSAEIVTLDDIEDAMFELTAEWERLGFYDGSDAYRDGIVAEQDDSDPGRINLKYTATALVDLDIISIVANRQAASL